MAFRPSTYAVSPYYLAGLVVGNLTDGSPSVLPARGMLTPFAVAGSSASTKSAKAMARGRTCFNPALSMRGLNPVGFFADSNPKIPGKGWNQSCQSSETLAEPGHRKVQTSAQAFQRIGLPQWLESAGPLQHRLPGSRRQQDTGHTYPARSPHRPRRSGGFPIRDLCRHCCW